MRFANTMSLKRLRRSAFTLYFIEFFMIILSMAAMISNRDAAIETGVFKDGYTLAALCYDCSEPDAVEVLKRDLEELENAHLTLALPREIMSLESNSVLILLKNIQSHDMIVELNKNGLRTALVMEEADGGIEALGDLISFIDRDNSEVVLQVSVSAASRASGIIGKLFDLKLEAASRFDVKITGFILDGLTRTSELPLTEAVTAEVMLFEYGSGINLMKPGENSVCSISVIQRDQSLTLSAYLGEYLYN